MKCFYCGNEAVGVCTSCGKAVCKDCAEFDNELICKNQDFCKTKKENNKLIYDFSLGMINKQVNQKIIGATSVVNLILGILFGGFGFLMSMSAFIPGMIFVVLGLVFAGHGIYQIIVNKKMSKKS